MTKVFFLRKEECCREVEEGRVVKVEVIGKSAVAGDEGKRSGRDLRDLTLDEVEASKI